jgi:hypothetical protein
MVVFIRGVITASIADMAVTGDVKKLVVYGVILMVAVSGVITRCLATYGSGVWTGITVMLIPAIRVAI